jgi:hypothetical protein
VSAPSYSLARTKTGKARPLAGARLSWALVREIRQWAARQGACLIQKDQIAVLQESYPLGKGTLGDILRNESWYDPRYIPGAPDVDYYRQFGEPSIMFFVLLASRYAAGR